MAALKAVRKSDPFGDGRPEVLPIGMNNTRALILYEGKRGGHSPRFWKIVNLAISITLIVGVVLAARSIWPPDVAARIPEPPRATAVPALPAPVFTATATAPPSASPFPTLRPRDRSIARATLFARQTLVAASPVISHSVEVTGANGQLYALDWTQVEDRGFYSFDSDHAPDTFWIKLRFRPYTTGTIVRVCASHRVAPDARDFAALAFVPGGAPDIPPPTRCKEGVEIWDGRPDPAPSGELLGAISESLYSWLFDGTRAQDLEEQKDRLPLSEWIVYTVKLVKVEP